jgi:hypothetical protein
MVVSVADTKGIIDIDIEHGRFGEILHDIRIAPVSNYTDYILQFEAVRPQHVGMVKYSPEEICESLQASNMDSSINASYIDMPPSKSYGLISLRCESMSGPDRCFV